MRILKLIPNTLTLLNLLSGCLAILFAVNNQIEYVFLLVSLGIFFDFFDGFAARIFKVSSELGKQLDSLADMVTSGVVPGIVMVQMMLKATNQSTLRDLQNFDSLSWLAMAGFIITLASCYRLANFNLDENQKDSFIGLPTPANTLLILSLPLLAIYPEYSYIDIVLDNVYVLVFITLLSAYLLNANLKLFALKFKTFTFADNKLKYFFLYNVVLSTK